jgi:hypothetical protein
MMSNNPRSFSSIGVVPVRFILQQVCYSSDKELKHDIYLLDDFCNFFKLSAIVTVSAA